MLRLFNLITQSSKIWKNSATDICDYEFTILILILFLRHFSETFHKLHFFSEFIALRDFVSKSHCPILC